MKICQLVNFMINYQYNINNKLINRIVIDYFLMIIYIEFKEIK